MVSEKTPDLLLMLPNDSNIYCPYLHYDVDKRVTNVQVPGFASVCVKKCVCVCARERACFNWEKDGGRA